MTLEKDSTKQGGSVCVLWVQERTVTQGLGLQEPGGREGSMGRCRASVSLGTLPTHCEVLLALCLLPRSDVNSVTEVESHIQADLMSACFTWLHVPDTVVVLKVSGTPASSKSIGAIFPGASAHCVSLRHGLVIVAVFQTLLQQKDNNSLKAQVMAKIF